MPEDPISRKVAQFYKDTLKIQQLQNAGPQSFIKSLKNELEATRDKQKAEMDNRHLPMTSKLILDKLKKESLLESTLKDLTKRMSKVEANLQLVLQNQVTQTEILAKLLFSAYGATSHSLDDNKKGEKEKVSQKINEDQQIKEDQHIKEDQQIKEDQRIISDKRKRSSASDQPTSKRQLQGLDAIEEISRAKEAQTKDLAEKDKKKLAELQRKTKEVISAVEKGTTIQTESATDSSVQSIKVHGSLSGVKPSGSNPLISISPPKPKGKSLFQEDIFPEPKDDS